MLLAAGAVAGAGTPDLRLGLANAVRTLDPRFATDAASSRAVRLVHAALVRFDRRFRAAPGLARWTRVGPGVYRFRLRPDRPRFSDGSPLTAEDVRATYASVLDPATASPHRGSLAGIEAIEVLDRDTVEFRLERADALFPGRLVIGIVPAREVREGADLARRPVGAGPFVLDGWPDENRVRLRRRRDGMTVELVRVPDPTVRALKLARGELDLVPGDLPPELVRWLGTRPGIRILRAPGINVSYLGFNAEDAVLGDVRVRRAVARAVDREAIVRHVLGGGARLAASLLVPEHWAGHPGLALPAHDPQRARALLREAGYGPGRRPRVVYKTSADPFRVRLATIIADQLERAGFDVALRSYDWGTFYGDVKAGRFDLYSLAWVGIKSPDIFRYTVHSGSVPPRGANRGRFADPEVDRLVEAAEAAPTLAEQARLYRRLQERLVERLPFVPLWFEDQVAALGPRVRGYRLRPDGNLDGLVEVRRPPTARGAP